MLITGVNTVIVSVGINVKVASGVLIFIELPCVGVNGGVVSILQAERTMNMLNILNKRCNFRIIIPGFNSISAAYLARSLEHPFEIPILSLVAIKTLQQSTKGSSLIRNACSRS